MNYIKYTHFIKNKTFQKCALGGLAIFTLLGSVGYLVKNEFLPYFKNEENEDNIKEDNIKKDNIEEDNEEEKKDNIEEDNEEEKKDNIKEEDNEIKKQIDEIENKEKNNDNNLDEYIKNYRENQELLDSEALKEHILEMNV